MTGGGIKMKKRINMRTVKYLSIVILLLVFISGCSTGSGCIKSSVSTSEPAVMVSTPQSSEGNENTLSPESSSSNKEFKFNYDEWNSSPFLTYGSKELQAANNAIGIDWQVSLDDGNVMVSHNLGYSNTFRFDIPDGYFIGEDLGEYGGTFTFYPLNGQSYKITDCNPIGMFTIGSDIYLLEGISHLLLNDGNIFNVKMNNGKWEQGDSFKLKGSPMAFTFKGDTLYVITDVAIIEVNKTSNASAELKTIMLAEHEFMQDLFPNSVVEANNILYIGMRGGILTYNLKSKESKWYVKS